MPLFPKVMSLLILPALLWLAGGCQLLGIAASKMPAATVPPAYEGLKGQSVAVWVWVDPGVDLDYPTLSLDVATRLQNDLLSARDQGNRRQKGELAGVTFPIEPASVVKYQKRDPMLNMTPITQLAPRLEVTRLIYVEIMDFTTQGGAAAGLLRGLADVNVSVIEVDPATKLAKPGYEEQGISFTFPPGLGEEGSSSLTERTVYLGLVQQVADGAALRFVSHPEPEGP
jgi:hypothetical protein